MTRGRGAPPPGVARAGPPNVFFFCPADARAGGRGAFPQRTSASLAASGAGGAALAATRHVRSRPGRHAQGGAPSCARRRFPSPSARAPSASRAPTHTASEKAEGEEKRWSPARRCRTLLPVSWQYLTPQRRRLRSHLRRWRFLATGEEGDAQAARQGFCVWPG